MTYNEWRDELKNNLLSVSEEERKRVLDYYAEAYADRRDAGFCENDIIIQFGAPYDAAKRILNENIDSSQGENKNASSELDSRQNLGNFVDKPQHMQGANAVGQPSQQKNSKWMVIAFICLALLFPPTWGVIAVVFFVIVVCATLPIMFVGCGAGAVVQSFFMLGCGEIAYWLCLLGFGFIAIGLGILLFPILIKLVKKMIELIKKAYCYIAAKF